MCAVHLTHCCNTCSTHNPTLLRCIQTLNLCTYICYIFYCLIPLLCGSNVCFTQMKDFNQAPAYKIKHHYEQETDKILRTNQFSDRWDVLPSPSTYITRPRWIYSWRSRIQKSISLQAAKLVGFCDYFLHSHALDRQTEWRLSICYLHCTPWAKESKVWHAFHFLYTTLFLFLSFY